MDRWIEKPPTGIEPVTSAYKADALPLSYSGALNTTVSTKQNTAIQKAQYLFAVMKSFKKRHRGDSNPCGQSPLDF